MKYLKKYKSFFEDGTASASASSTAGMGAVSAASPGSLAGTTGTTGSGDLGFVFKKEKRKKGDPTKVTDMRDLAPAKGVTHVEDIKESEMTLRPRDPAYDPETRNMINDCLIELYDLDFELTMMDYDKQRFSVDLDDEETGYFDQEELRISIHKKLSQIWDGNITISCKFDENGIISKNVSTLRAVGKSLDEREQKLFDLVEEVALKLINNLDYQSGEFTIQWLSVNFDRRESNNINLNVSFILNNNLKH